ncbi:hypothetical protein HNQ07_001693 [Deinococcus metalli]|uniref:Holin n=1 Tax=Deinococcus metalli TaxID=1141878 RepID=A0A7W8NNY2_9DEIO|nr:hypothetical protein [Deinococcus metalli]MBB5376236.1 hypothetical protein [Deinococcus metalli]GHF39782.1 hypothetical protein GCM10017781_15460 [Deinococcus metalli]
MSDVAPPTFALLQWLPTLATAFAAGTVTQLARQLAAPGPLRVRSTVALAVAAGIAALSVVALLAVTLPTGTSAALLLAAACVTGWSGPGILARLGQLVERRLGLPATPQPFDPPADRQP